MFFSKIEIAKPHCRFVCIFFCLHKWTQTGYIIKNPITIDIYIQILLTKKKQIIHGQNLWYKNIAVFVDTKGGQKQNKKLTINFDYG